jgi:D-threo-aldose 1-dehydrogenase
MPTAESLPKRLLGRTGLLVTPICVGCAPLGSMPEVFGYSVTEEQAFTTLRAIFRTPINFIDTAASYGDGENERRVGMALRELGAGTTGR